MDFRSKAFLFLALVSILLFAGCLNQTDSIVGCWQYPGAFGLTGDYSFSSDGTFMENAAGIGVSGSWSRIDANTIQLTFYNSLTHQNQNQNITYDSQTKTIYLKEVPDVRFSKVKCPN